MTTDAPLRSAGEADISRSTCLITLACPLCQAPVTHDCVMTDLRLEYDPNATREDAANDGR